MLMLCVRWAYRTQEPEIDPNLEEPPLTGQGWSDVQDKLGVPVPEEAAEVWNQMLAYSMGLPESVRACSGGMMDEMEDEHARVIALEWLLFCGGDPVTTEVNTPLSSPLFAVRLVACAPTTEASACRLLSTISFHL
jgi:hypothetical protein